VLHIFSHHKCATTWLGWFLHGLSEANDLTFFRSHLGYERPSPTANISFLMNADYDAIRVEAGPQSLHVIRNPLNMVLSAYYSHLKTHPLDGWPELERQRHVLQQVSFSEGLLLTIAFLESHHFSRGTRGPLCCMKNWNYSDERIQTLRMEDLVVDVRGWLRSLEMNMRRKLVLPDLHHYYFKNFTKRQVGEVDSTSHYRSGSPEQWKKELTAPAINYIKSHYGDLICKFYPEILLEHEPASFMQQASPSVQQASPGVQQTSAT